MRLRLHPPDLGKLFIGQHVINGVSVGVGVMAVALVASAIFGFVAGQPATVGAISASISDLPAPWRDKARSMGFGFALALISTAAIQFVLPWRLGAWLTVGAIAFAAGLVTGLGRWALAVAMQMVISMVFVLRLPRADFVDALHNEALFAAGGLGYLAFALFATFITDASARRLVASESIREFANYLRAVAAVYDPKQDLTAAYGALIRQQAALSEQMQSARALLLDRPRATPERLRLSATIGVLLDAFDALIAAQCDVALIRDTPTAQAFLASIDVAVRIGARDLEHLSLELLATGNPTLPPDHQLASEALKREGARIEADQATSAEARQALAAATRHLTLALGHVRQLEKVLSDDRAAQESIGDVDLGAFIPRRSYALVALASEFNFDSPVLRFAVRIALAMMSGALIAVVLGGEQHGNWVMLTIAVILRANYGLTRQRRDDRVVGTLVGCIVAAGAVAYLPLSALVAVQGLSLTLTHSFVRLNYRLASIGASVTALVSLHLVQPALPAPVLARLADTLIGAAIAHLFSYVWPRWEFAEAPRIAKRLQDQLAAFAAVALRPDAPVQDYRLARKNVIEAIAALSDSAGRMSIEPTVARRGLDEMAALLIAAHRLIAELSVAHLSARTGAPAPGPATRDWLQRLLSSKSYAAEAAEAPSGSLAAAAFDVLEEAQKYERASRSEL